MFFGRISDVYLGVITLTVTLILFNLVNSTSGERFHIGSAPLGGFNGIPSIPTLHVPGFPERTLDAQALFAVCVAFLTAVYIGLRLVLASHFGRVLVAIRENESCALVVVEHDMEFIKMIARKVTVFNRGEVLLEDTVERVLVDERVRDVYLGRELAMKG